MDSSTGCGFERVITDACVSIVDSCCVIEVLNTHLVRPTFPLDNVVMILGNDLAGSAAWADVLPSPVVITASIWGAG